MTVKNMFLNVQDTVMYLEMLLNDKYNSPAFSASVTMEVYFINFRNLNGRGP